MLQGIADVYAFLSQNDRKMTEFYEKCKGTPLDGFLLKMIPYVMENYSISDIKDNCKMNNTGLWCVEYAYKHNINTPVMHAAVQSRIASNTKVANCNQNIHMHMQTPFELAYEALLFLYAMAVYEGLLLIEHKGIDIKAAQSAWSKATIIQCPLVQFEKSELLNIMEEYSYKTRIFIIENMRNCIPVPVASAAIQHYDIIHQKHTQMSLIMAQRHHFGQHTYESLK
jgi:6-phosphogluconate dehydrogenase